MTLSGEQEISATKLQTDFVKRLHWPDHRRARPARYHGGAAHFDCDLSYLVHDNSMDDLNLRPGFDRVDYHDGAAR